jgi:hypothetical protein
MVTYLDKMALVIECPRTVCLGPGLEPGKPRIRNESESHSTGTEIREVLGVIK